ncbi:MAG: 16S rRNA (uracil(1498)-N(3))-methyltransferase [Acidobacteria bacterium]|nr:16S rRNA (uracil(1498)-N(3))-methyltransferase [Acidobacteriota bacterium]
MSKGVLLKVNDSPLLTRELPQRSARSIKKLAMRRFYSRPENFNDRIITLDTDETRHLRDVLRLKTGDEVSVFDGTGHEYKCSITAIGKKDSELALIEEITPASPESPFEITLASTVLNGEKYDLIIQKSVELGVAKLIPVQTIRGDVKTKDADKRLDRWRRIAMEATKQCGRARLMEIAEPTAVEKLIAETTESVVMFSERDGTDFTAIKPGKKITALIGPKGGWDDSELELARASGISVVTLGGRILRAETAAISLTTILQHRFGDLN